MKKYISLSQKLSEFTYTIAGVMDDTLFLNIGGKIYGYKETEEVSFKKILRVFGKMYVIDKGKALLWLKRNTDLVYGSVKIPAKIKPFDFLPKTFA